MGYAQWAIIYINNKSRGASLEIKNVSKDGWGRFYTPSNPPTESDKDTILDISKIEGHVVRQYDKYAIASRGKENEWAGCSGEFDVHEQGAINKLCHISFSCPHALNSNNAFSITEKDASWTIEYEGANISGGALGSIYVTFTQI